MIAEMVLALAVGGWLIYRWNHKILRRSSPLFLLLIIVGILLVLTAGIIMSAGLSSSAMCILYVFFLVTGMTLILANLLVKNWRIYKIFSNRRADAVQLSDLQLLAITAFLVVLIWIQFFVYSFAGGTIALTRLQGKDNPFYVFDLCESPTAWFQTFQIIAYYVFFAILVVTTGVLGFLTRKAHAGYSESRNIALIIYIYVCMAIIFIPLYYVQGLSTNSQDTRYVIVSISMLILMLATLLILFLPKILLIERTRRHLQD